MTDKAPVPTKRKAAPPRGTQSGKPGRPTSLTPAVQRRICEAIEAGNYLETAAAYGGVTSDTVRNWLARADTDGGIYADFRDAYAKAEADSEASLVADWRAGARQDWRGARDLLARRFPGRWKPVEETRHAGHDGGPVIVVIEYADGNSATPSP